MKKKKTRGLRRSFYAALSYLSPRLNTRLLFKRKFGRWPDLEEPKTLNEKLLKLKLESFGTDPLVRQCADKYAVRSFVEERGLGHILNGLIAVYDRPQDIDFEALPERFAIKWNFGCGYNLIVPDKSALDIPAAVRQLEKWGKEPFWSYYSELQYRGVEKKIIIEDFIQGKGKAAPEDYKFYCFDGHAYCCMVCQGREEGWPKFYFMDRNFELLRINRDSKAAPEGFSLPMPKLYPQAIEAAETLSKGFPFVRVDLYVEEDRLIFGEMTFTPAAALDNQRLPETDLLFGSIMEGRKNLL